MFGQYWRGAYLWHSHFFGGYQFEDDLVLTLKMF